MKIAVVGSRKMTDKDFVFKKLVAIINEFARDGHHITIISGGAKGTDQLAQEYAREFNHDFVLFKPYHLIDPQMDYNPRFFFTRNKQIADNADLVIAFWDGQSSGTRHIIEYCQRNRKSYMVEKFDG